MAGGEAGQRRPAFGSSALLSAAAPCFEQRRPAFTNSCCMLYGNPAAALQSRTARKGAMHFIVFPVVVVFLQEEFKGIAAAMEGFAWKAERPNKTSYIVSGSR